MDDETPDDRQRTKAISPTPDAHGQAAILLVESLLHGLIARSLITVAEAVEIVDIAAEVKADITAEVGVETGATRNSQTLLESISHSLKFDLPRA